MATYSQQKLGGTSTSNMAVGDGAVQRFTQVFDIAKAVADGYASGDSAAIMTFPAGFFFVGFDAEIVEAIVTSGGAGTVDIGTTAADPDEYVDAQTTTAVGRFGSYVADCVAQSVFAAATTLYIEINATTITSGKIAVSVLGAPPARIAPAPARPKQYPND